MRDFLRSEIEKISAIYEVSLLFMILEIKSSNWIKIFWRKEWMIAVSSQVLYKVIFPGQIIDCWQLKLFVHDCIYNFCTAYSGIFMIVMMQKWNKIMVLILMIYYWLPLLLQKKQSETMARSFSLYLIDEVSGYQSCTIFNGKIYCRRPSRIFAS